ncbi:hypothetical protein BGZ88_005014, partial [Linnemannia elongata]
MSTVLTAKGTFQVLQPGSTFLAKFTVGEKSHTFEGTCGSSSLEACMAVVVLTYAQESDLTSAQTFFGDIGKTKLKIT